MLKTKTLLSPFILSFIISLISCSESGDKKDFPNPPGYDLSAGTQIKLTQELDEISGVFYYPKDSSVFCINDEKGFLYKVFLDKSKEVQKWRFTKRGDFEDLLLLDSSFYVLQSSGNLLSFKFFSGDSIQLDTIQLPLKGNNEFEILYYDQGRKEMILVCKECEQDKKNKVSAIAYNPKMNTTTTAYILQEEKIKEQLKEKGRFKPSAAGIHPITNELFIISSVNKALVICDVTGNVKHVYKLDPKIFKQPEGLTFTPSGDLIVSNESADKGSANIMFYPYKKTSK